MNTSRSFLEAGLILSGSVFALYPAVGTLALFVCGIAGLGMYHLYQNRPVAQKIRLQPNFKQSNAVRIEKF